MNKKIIGLVVCLIVFYSFNVISVDEIKKATGLNCNSRLIELDCNKINGTINHYGDINCGPIPNHNTIDGVDLTDQYMRLLFR